MGAHVWKDLGCLICLSLFFRSRAGTNQKENQKIPIFLNTCAIVSELPSKSSTMYYTEYEYYKEFVLCLQNWTYYRIKSLYIDGAIKLKLSLS